MGGYPISSHFIGRYFIGRHLMDRHLMDRYLIGGHLMGRYLMGRYLIGRHLIDRHLMVWFIYNDLDGLLDDTLTAPEQIADSASPCQRDTYTKDQNPNPGASVNA
jgi:hypothetical protein